MYITELTGYKDNPYYKTAQDIFKNSDNLKQFDFREQALKKFMNHLSENGFKQLGDFGQGGVVFEHPSYSWVFKLFTHDPEYLRYLNYALAHQNNPHVPKIKGKMIKINNETFVVRMEKLYRSSREETHTLATKLRSINDIEFFNSPFMQEEIKLLKTDYPGIYKIITDLLHTNPDSQFDFHSENIMERKDGTIVIIDPLRD